MYASCVLADVNLQALVNIRLARASKSTYTHRDWFLSLRMHRSNDPPMLLLLPLRSHVIRFSADVIEALNRRNGKKNYRYIAYEFHEWQLQGQIRSMSVLRDSLTSNFPERSGNRATRVPCNSDRITHAFDPWVTPRPLRSTMRRFRLLSRRVS